MSELLKIVLSLSLSGTLLFFIVLALKPLYKNKLSKRWQYYIWLIVIVRMLIPFTPETTLVGSAFQHLGNINVGTIQFAPPANDVQSDFEVGDNYTTPNTEPQAPNSTIDTTLSLSIQTIITKLYENLWILWAAIAFALLIRKITMYQSFVRFVKAGRAEVSDIELLNMLADVGESIGVKRPVELFVNPLISSPMLLGFFRPYIILPSIELDKTELAYIMRHELTHYKHLDMFYKWFVQITVCLHWFNPFAYLMAKEINKCCELSCDEAIIRTMDKDEKKAYGDTLLNSLKGMGNYNDKLATVTLTEGAEQLKERLEAIMKFKKKSKTIIAITLALTTMLCVGATAVGAYAAPQTAVPKMPVTINTSNKAEVSYDKDYAEWDITHIDDTYYYQNKPVRIFMDLRADNSFANFFYNKNGSIDLRLIRNSSDSIVKVEQITEAEADEILSDFEENPSTKEDIKRLTLEEVPNAIQSAVNSCDDKTWYVIDGDGRQYIYYNNLPHNYAYQYEPKQNSLKIVDIGKTNGNYVLLSVPINSNLTISYNSKSVTYKKVSGEVSALQDINADNAKSISITAKSCGIELVKSESNQFTFDYLGIENPSAFKVNASSKGNSLDIIVDGTAAKAAGEHYYIDDGANPVNIVRIGIPDREYQNLTMTLNEAPVTLSDFKAKVTIQAEDGTVSIADKDISKGSYNINNTSGGVSITANTVLSNISIENQGECELTFHQMPQNLDLNLSACQGQIILPDGWSKNQTFGNGVPSIKINNQGYTEVKVDETQKTVLEMEMDANYSSSEPFENGRLFCVSEDIETLNAEVYFLMDGESGIVEIKDRNADKVLWSNTWDESVSGDTVTVSLNNLQKEKEYVVRFTGTKINNAVVKVTFDSELVQEKSRPSK